MRVKDGRALMFSAGLGWLVASCSGGNREAAEDASIRMQPLADAGDVVSIDAGGDAGEEPGADAGSIDSGSPMVSDGGAVTMDAGAGDADAGSLPGRCPAEGLRAEYRFDEVDLGIDSSGCENHAAVIGTVRTTVRAGGEAIELSGLGQLSTDGSERLDIKEAFTFMAWVRKDDETIGAIVSRGNGTGGDSFVFHTDPGSTNRLSVTLGNHPTCSGMGTDVAPIDAAVPSGAWTHVAATRSDDARLTFYIDGREVGSNITLSGMCETSEGIQIGAIDGTRNWPFHGAIDELQIWNIELDVAAICTASGGTLVGDSCDRS